jgi:hypothetical protein
VRRLNDEAEKQLRDGRYGAGIVPAQRAVELSESSLHADHPLTAHGHRGEPQHTRPRCTARWGPSSARCRCTSARAFGLARLNPLVRRSFGLASSEIGAIAAPVMSMQLTPTSSVTFIKIMGDANGAMLAWQMKL